MPTPTWQFNNTDLHNIYDAITDGFDGGGTDVLCGQLLDGQVDPSNLGGFYPILIEQIKENTKNIFNLFDGGADPSNLTGFYPDKLEFIDIELIKINSHAQYTATNNADIDTTLLKTIKFGIGSGNTLAQFGGTNIPYTSCHGLIALRYNTIIANAYIVANFILPLQPSGNTNFNYASIYAVV